MQENILSTNFKLKSIIKYTLPTTLMLIFMSTYTIVDGIFVSNLVGENALSAVNLVVPVFGIVMAISLMFGTGGVAIVGKFMGENKYKEARGFLSTIYIIGTTLGLILTILGFIFREQFVAMLGANEVLAPYTYDYFMSILPFVVPMFLQVFVQTFFVTAGKPGLGFGVCIAGGITNMILDYVFISPNSLDLGITGAGLATGIGNAIPGIFGVIYFIFNRKGTLYFGKPLLKARLILQCMYNGSSELVSNLSSAITTLLFNFMMLKIVGPNGVAAISVILYVQMFQMAIYIGYSMGIAPVISYKYGEQNKEQLSHIVNISLKIISVFSVLVVTLSILFSDLAVSIFISRDSDAFLLAKKGFMIFSVAYLFMGINIFVSALFTALSNGKISAILSMCRTLVLTVISLIVFPILFNVTGIWIAVPIAEFIAIFLSIYFYKKYKSYYGY